MSNSLKKFGSGPLASAAALAAANLAAASLAAATLAAAASLNLISLTAALAASDICCGVKSSGLLILPKPVLN